MIVTIINPNIVTQKGDFFGTGIPYMPIIPAYLASHLLSKKYKVEVIDSFGQNPTKKRIEGDLIIHGLSLSEILNKVNKKTDLICIYAGHIVEHSVIVKIIKVIKKRFKEKKILVFENSQAVTAYSLRIAHRDFFDQGCDYVVYGNPEETVNKLLSGKSLKTIDGLIYRKAKIIIINKPHTQKIKIDDLPFPAWHLFPIVNYWKLGYAHVPYKKRYMPLLTSRGCPFECAFCIIPFTNRRKWRGRTAENVFEEMKKYVVEFDVNEFHIEDLNPTINRKRIEKLCKLIIKSGLSITFKFASGIKIETIDRKTLDLLYKAGCRYISFSPESGSEKVLKLMKKPFNYKHGLEMTRVMSKLGIVSQACFVLGFPGETKSDLRLTQKYALQLVRKGVDELAFFIMTPVPGSKPYEFSQIKDLSKLTFSPKWRKEYKFLHKFRFKLYLLFVLLKFLYSPLRTVTIPLRILIKNFRTKIEMTVYRVFNQTK